MCGPPGTVQGIRRRRARSLAHNLVSTTNQQPPLGTPPKIHRTPATSPMLSTKSRRWYARTARRRSHCTRCDGGCDGYMSSSGGSQQSSWATRDSVPGRPAASSGTSFGLSRRLRHDRPPGSARPCPPPGAGLGAAAFCPPRRPPPAARGASPRTSGPVHTGGEPWIHQRLCSRLSHRGSHHSRGGACVRHARPSSLGSKADPQQRRPSWSQYARYRSPVKPGTAHFLSQDDSRTPRPCWHAETCCS